MAETNNILTLKLDKETTLPLIEQLGRSAYAIAVAHGFKGTEQEWIDSLRGPKGDPGDKGDPFKFSDFTQEQLNALKGKKGDTGDPGSAEKAAELLKGKNVYLPDASVDTVLAKLVEILGDTVQVHYKNLEYSQPAQGQTFLDLKGEPHFKVSINGGEKLEFESDNMRINIEPFGAEDINIDYYGVNDLIVGHIQILKPAAQSFVDKNGITLSKDGRVLAIDLTNQTDNIDKNYDISDRPAWVYDGVTEFKFISNAPNKIIGYAETSKIPIDKLYTTLNAIANPNIKTIYFQYGDETRQVLLPTILKIYRSTGSGESRKVVYMGQRTTARQVSGVTRTKADYFAVLTEPFDGLVQGFGDFYKTAPDNE